MSAWWLIPAGMGLLTFLWPYDLLMAKEVVENVIVRGRSYTRSLRIPVFFWRGGGSPLLVQMSRDRYCLIFEFDDGKTKLLEVSQGVYEKTFEGTSIKVRCAKGKILGKRIKSLVQ